MTRPPVRVLYSFPHSLDRPGIATTALNQILGLERLGFEITLFCTAVGSVRLPPTITVHQTLVVAGRRIPHRALGVQRAYSYHDRRVAGWLSRNADQIDVVHAWPRGCLRTLMTAAELGIPGLRESPNPHTASVMRESAAAAQHAGVELPETHSHAVNREVLAREEREYRAARAVLVPSSYARAEFLREGFPADRLLQHRYGCDLSRFRAREARVIDRARPFRAVFIGRGDPTKGLHVALAAWERASIPGAQFLIAGSLLPEYERVLAERLKLPGVRALGFVADVPALLAEADVLVLPTWTEGSALVTLEAQASGCVPLVSSAAGALGTADLDFLEHPVGAVDVLADQLTQLADDRDRLERLARRGTARREELSWDAAAEALAACYRRVLEPSAAKSR